MVKRTYTVNSKIATLLTMSSRYTASERLIIWVLKASGPMTKDDIMSETAIPLRSFNRAWVKLKNEGIVISQRHYELTERGELLANQLAQLQRQPSHG